MLGGEQRRGGSRRDPELSVDVLDVACDGLLRDDEPLRDLAVREAESQQAEHLDLARGEPRGPFASTPDAVPGGCQHGIDGGTVQPAGLDFLPKLLRRPVGLERRSVRARLDQRVVHVGRRQDPRTGTQGAPPKPAVVARAVEPLVMLGRQLAEWRKRPA